MAETLTGRTPLAAVPDAPPVSRIDRILQHQGRLVAELVDIRNRVHKLADRLVGEPPAGAGSGVAEPPEPKAVVDLLEYGNAGLSRQAEQINNELNRLEAM